MKTKLLFLLAVAFTSATFFFASCNKSNSADAPAGSQNVSLILTDGPGFYNNVYLDVKSVEVVVDTSKNTREHDSCNWNQIGSRGPIGSGAPVGPKPDSSLVWQSLGVTAGLYDLLQLKNGVDTVLGAANIPAGAIRLIKIDLGTASYIIKDSVKYALNLLPNAPSYILVQLKGNEFEHFTSNGYRLWLDFDVQRSIVNVNGTYYLSPFLTALIMNKWGSVTGNIAPKDAWPEIVTVYNGTDTAYAITNRDNGMFKIRGLKDETYSANFHVSNGYKDTTITGITISNASTVNLGSITVHK